MIGARVAVLGLVLWIAACATGGTATPTTDPGEQMRVAVRALERDDFPGATQPLAAVASDCTEASRGPRALLLLAAATLDTGNPEGSPVAAARLAARYLLLAEASPDEWILARTLYRVATHLVTLAPRRHEGDDGSSESVQFFDSCEPTSPTDDALLMHALGSAAAPWLLDLESDRTALRRHVEELQAEIDRIDELLTSSGTPDASEPGR